MYHIYFLRDINGTVKYVGQTQHIDQRMTEHKRTKPLHTFEVIYENINSIDAKSLEIENIDKYDTYKNGWNKTKGGEGFEGCDRKGIGGVKKGNIPWNKGKSGCFNEETIEKFKTTRRGNVYSRKLTDTQIKEIRKLYKERPEIEGVGDTMKNGRKMSYVQAFCKKYSSEYNITLQGMKKVILEECWKNV